MEINELQSIMIKHGVTIRAIPNEIVSTYEARHVDHFPEGQIYYDKHLKRGMLRVVKIPKYAGKFIMVKNCGTGGIVAFSKPKFYNSIEEAISELEHM